MLRGVGPIVSVACLGGLLFGYDTAVISGTVAALEAQFVAPRGLAVDQANSLLGFAVGAALIGCVIGGVLAGFMSHRLGRRGSLRICAVLFALSAIGSAYPELLRGSANAATLWWFIGWRILGGIGVGIASMLSPMYIAEISPPARRGQLVAYNQIAIVTGMVVVYFVNYAIARLGDDAWNLEIGWRYMFLSEVLPAVAFFVLLLFVPESPRWLVGAGREAEARGVLERLHGAGDHIARETTAIVASLRETTSGLFAFGVLLIVMGIVLSVFQQFVGINVVLYYAPEIFKDLGAGTNAAMLQTVLVGVVNVAFTVVAILCVDGWGRRPLLILGALGMAAAMFGLGTVLYLDVSGVAALLCMLLYIAMFALSWGPVVWVLLSEMFPNSIRAKAMAIAVAAQWLSNYLVSSTFPVLNNNPELVARFNHGFAYWLYGAMALLAALIIWRWLPETRGVALEDMPERWHGGS
ncbi:MAG: D-xylose transporter XylE [Pseudomonadota bacterium]